MNIKDFIIEGPNRCIRNGDVWANEIVQTVFKDIDLENDNRTIVKSIFEYIKFLREECCLHFWIQNTLTIGEAKKLNAIMKCKTISTLRNKLDKFSYEITKDRFYSMSHRNKIARWEILKASIVKLIDKGELKMKLCNHCGEVKYNSDFYKNKHNKDGLQAWCKECQLKATSVVSKRYKTRKRNTELKRLSLYKINEGLNYKLDRGSDTIIYNCLNCGKEVTSSLNKAWKNRYKCDECMNNSVKHTHIKEKPIIVRVHEYYISDDIIENKEEKKSIFSWIKNLFRRNK